MLKGAEAQRTLSYISVIFGLAPAIAPVVGGWLQAALGWRSIFFCIAFFSVVLLLFCLRLLPESLPREQRHPFHFKVILANYWEVVCHGRFICGALAGGLLFSTIMLYVSSAPAFVLHLLHLSVKEFSWLFLPLIGGLTLGSAISGRLSHRLSPDNMIRLGFAIMVLAAVLDVSYASLFSPRVPWAVIPLFFYGLGIAVAAPGITILNLEIFPRVKGLASSLQGFFSMLIFSFVSGAVAPLLFDSALKLAIGGMVGLALSAFFWWLSRRPAAEVISLPAPAAEA